MFTIEKEKLREFEELIQYSFNNKDLLIQALTTKKLGKETGTPHYEVLETLGDAVIKLIFSLKLYQKGKTDSGEITKIRQSLESNRTFETVARKIDLQKYIFTSKKQKIEGTSVLPDIFEAICGALYIDSGENLKVVEQKIIDQYFQNWEEMIDPTIFNKNILLEYLQKKHGFTPRIEPELENRGSDNAPKWVAKNPKILDNKNKLLVELPTNLTSAFYNTIKEAEQDLYLKILKFLKNTE